MFVQLKQIAQSCSGLGLGVVWTPTDKTEPRPAAWVLPAWCYLNKLSGIACHHVFWELLPWGCPRLLDNVLSCRSSCWVLGFTVEVGNHPHSEGTFFKSTVGPSYLPRWAGRSGWPPSTWCLKTLPSSWSSQQPVLFPDPCQSLLAQGFSPFLLW